MKLEMIVFQGSQVGFRIRPDNDRDKHLLWSLRGQVVKVSETFGMEMPSSLTVCPSLPWKNQVEGEASVEERI